MKTVFRFVKPYVGVMLFGLVLKLAGTFAELLLPWMLSYIVDTVVPTGDNNAVYAWGGAMLICSFGALAGNVCANRLASRTSKSVAQGLRYALFEKTFSLSCRNTDGVGIPSLISRLTSDTYNIHQMLDRMQRLGVRAPILLLGGVAVTVGLDFSLALILVCMMPLLGGIVFYISRKGIPMYTKTQTLLDSVVGRVQEYMAGVRVIRALSGDSIESERFYNSNDELVKSEQKAAALMALTNPVMSLTLNIGLVLVIVVGAYRVDNGLVQPGVVIAFLSYFTIILNAILMVSRLFVMYSKGAASAKRVEEILIMPEDGTLSDLPAINSPFHIEFRNVSFSYNGNVKDIDNISFALHRGEKLGIIGATGSGKTTLLMLLMRLYDVDSGEILINGRDVRTIPREELCSMFGAALQNDFLFAGSVEDNVEFFRHITAEQTQTALDIAQAGFAEEKGDGISIKGSNLSGGQRQRLFVARAVAGSPEILLLDDCSSALDYVTDASLRRAINEKLSSSTAIIVAQRVSSVMSCDKILVLDDGKTLGLGTHSQLLESCVQYRDIYAVQMGEGAQNG